MSQTANCWHSRGSGDAYPAVTGTSSLQCTCDSSERIVHIPTKIPPATATTADMISNAFVIGNWTSFPGPRAAAMSVNTRRITHNVESPPSTCSQILDHPVSGSSSCTCRVFSATNSTAAIIPHAAGLIVQHYSMPMSPIPDEKHAAAQAPCQGVAATLALTTMALPHLSPSPTD